MGGAQGRGAAFGEVRVSDLVTMRIRAEKHLSTQTCSHLTSRKATGLLLLRLRQEAGKEAGGLGRWGVKTRAHSCRF